MKRTGLVPYQQCLVTPDVVEALRHFNIRAVEYGLLDVAVEKPQSNTPSALAMAKAGREIHLHASVKEVENHRPISEGSALPALWGLAVPCGFTPWRRYPVVEVDDPLGHRIFHYLGPWQTLLDHLIGEGRGEAAWSSVCCAAQVDVGAWEGDYQLERFVQAQLHRIGVSVGPVDGRVGNRTLTGLKRAGLDRQTLAEAAEVLSGRDKTPDSPALRRVGHVVLPGQNCSIATSGQVYSTSTAQGAALTVDGPGRVVIDVIPKE